MDYFDLGDPHGGRLADAFRQSPVRFGLVSFDSDWLYPTAESRRIVQALHAAGAQASFVALSSPFGPDAFLLDSPELFGRSTAFTTPAGYPPPNPSLRSPHRLVIRLACPPSARSRRAGRGEG